MPRRLVAARTLRYHPEVPGQPPRNRVAPEDAVSVEPPAKFFVNSGLVSSKIDLLHLLRPLYKQTVSYRYFRGSELIGHGTGWVERIVTDQPGVSTYFTPLAISLNVDSFEYLEFETRPDQLVAYTLVQGEERVEIDYLPAGAPSDDAPAQQTFEFPRVDYVQMELTGLDPVDGGSDPERGSGGRRG